MKTNFTPFERNLREKLEGHEMPYEPASWADIQRQMGIAKSGRSVWLISLVSTIMTLTAGSIALYCHQHSLSSALKASTTPHFNSPTTNTVKGTSHNSSNSSIRIVETSLIDLNAKTPIISPKNKTELPEHLNPQQKPVFTLTGSQVSSVIPVESSFTKNSVVADNIIEFGCNVRKACQGEEVEFQSTNGPKTGSYLWNFGDGHFSDDINPKHKFSKSGHYDVSLSITSDNGQINTTVVNDMITIEEAPDADFTWEFINSDPSSPEVKVINLTDGGNSFEWSNGIESGIIADGATFKLQNNGRQTIALSAKNTAGCSDGAVKHICVNSDFNLGAPKQWSASDGPFMPQGLKKSKVDFTLSIYDASGNRVFETENRTKGWDGKLPGGSSAVSGSTYTYKIIITSDRSQEQKYFFGTFNVFP
jgi:PKD repeat protein